jgi:chitodextrinase
MKRFALGIAACISLATLGMTSLAQSDQLGPNAITLTVGVGKTTAVLSWTSPGDQCTNATVAAYDIRYSTSSIDACNFESATSISAPTPQSPGNQECVELSGLTSGATYWFAVKSRDSAGNWSVISNVVQKTTKTFGGEILCN